MLTFQTAAEWWLASCRARNLSPGSLHYYTIKLAPILADIGTMDVTTVTIHHLRQVLAHQQQIGASTAQMNHIIITMKAMVNWLYAEDVIPSNPVTRLKKLKAVDHIPDVVAPETLQALLAACPRDFHGQRDKAMLLTLLDTGLRLSELLGLTMGTIDMDNRRLRIMGKGRKERLSPFSATLAVELTRYGAQRATRIHPGVEAWWITRNGKPLSANSFSQNLYRLCDLAQVPHIHPHQLRHTYATEMLRNGANTHVVQRALGHTTEHMTARYLHLVDDDLRAAHTAASPLEHWQDKLAGKRRR